MHSTSGEVEREEIILDNKKNKKEKFKQKKKDLARLFLLMEKIEKKDNPKSKHKALWIIHLHFPQLLTKFTSFINEKYLNNQSVNNDLLFQSSSINNAIISVSKTLK